MKSLKTIAAGLCVLTLVSSCATKQGTGSLIGAGGEPYLAQTTGEIQGSKKELKQQAVHRLLMNP